MAAFVDDYETKPKSPPAFGNGKTGSTGMSLRDYFAGQALAGIMASDNKDVGRQAIKAGIQIEILIGRMAYLMADEMLAAREATPDA